MPVSPRTAVPTDPLRLFVAVELPAAVKDALASTIAALRAAGDDDILRYVRVDGVHLTLKFLGAVNASRVGAIDAALRNVLAGAASCELQSGGLGSFGGTRALRVVWLGIAGDTGTLAALAERVESALTPLGFPHETRSFAAHLTLARVRDGASPADRARIHALIEQVVAPLAPSFRVESVSLMQSAIGRGGAVYHALHHYPLTDRPPS